MKEWLILIVDEKEDDLASLRSIAYARAINPRIEVLAGIRNDR